MLRDGLDDDGKPSEGTLIGHCCLAGDGELVAVMPQRRKHGLCGAALEVAAAVATRLVRVAR